MTVQDKRQEDRSRPGPFPESAGQERPWEATETEYGPFERRRSGDRRGMIRRAEAEAPNSDEGSERRRWGRRKSDVLDTDSGGFLSDRNRRVVRRMREPLIGLTLAGIAAPLINAGMTPAEEAGGTEAERARAASAEAATAERDLDEEVGDYWADSEADVVRENTIEGAMTRYQIDRALAEQIYDAAERHNIEADVAFGLVNTESTFRERAVSHVGARGLTQVMPRTAQWLDPSIRVSELFNTERNLDLGFKYLRMMIDKYEGNVENALTAYNRGPGTVDKILKRGGNPDNGYAGKVLAG